MVGMLRVAAAGAEDRELIADRAWFLGANAVGERADGLDIGFATVDLAEAAARDLGARFHGADVEVVDAADALEAAKRAWMQHARPERVGEGFVVRPAWLPEEEARADDVVLAIDPTEAFGNGAHPSTRRCLEAIERYVSDEMAVLDVGCGSGVLAVAAALLGASPVVAVDVDPTAIEATRANAARNGVDVTVSTAAVADVGGEFGLVLANVGAAAALAMHADLSERVAPGGRLVVAGLVEARAADVIDGFTELGLLVDEVQHDGEWVSIHHVRAKLHHTVPVPGKTMEDRT